MTHHVLYGGAVFASAIMAQALWAGHPSSQFPEHPSRTAATTSTGAVSNADAVSSAGAVTRTGAVTSAAAVTSARSGGYPYANAVCEFGRRGGAYCANPRNGGDMYDWGYWRGRGFRASDQWGYEYRNCTSYVAWRLTRARVPASLFSSLGDASDWIAGVRGERGVVVNNRPSPGAVATWDLAGVGHVAWVVSVRGSRVTVADYNYAGTGAFDQHAIGSPRPTAYIHFPARLPAVRPDNSNKPREGPGLRSVGAPQPPRVVPVSDNSNKPRRGADADPALTVLITATNPAGGEDAGNDRAATSHYRLHSDNSNKPRGGPQSAGPAARGVGSPRGGGKWAGLGFLSWLAWISRCRRGAGSPGGRRRSRG
jgi:surface antigen